MLHFIADLIGCTDLQTPRGSEAGLDFSSSTFSSLILCCSERRPSPAPAQRAEPPPAELGELSPAPSPRKRPFVSKRFALLLPSRSVFLFYFFFIFLFFNPCWEVPASCTPVLSDCGLQPAPTKRKLDWAPSPHTSGGFGSLFLAPPMAFSGGGAGAGPEPRAGRVYFCTWGTRWERHAAASCSHFCSPLFSQLPPILGALQPTPGGVWQGEAASPCPGG